VHWFHLHTWELTLSHELAFKMTTVLKQVAKSSNRIIRATQSFTAHLIYKFWMTNAVFCRYLSHYSPLTLMAQDFLRVGCPSHHPTNRVMALKETLLLTLTSRASSNTFIKEALFPFHNHHNRFTALFPEPTGWAGARRELLDFMVQGKINRGRQTDRQSGWAPLHPD